MGLAAQWMQNIGRLYELRRRRREQFSAPVAEVAEVTAAFMAADAQLADAALADPARKVPKVMKTCSPGLVVFFEHPWLDLDNNAAERALCPAVVGRKNLYGSGSPWSGQLAATVLSVLGTVRLWDVNPRIWLQAYLQACAHAGGQPPADIARFIAWRMSPIELAAMRRAIWATAQTTRTEPPDGQAVRQA